MITVGNRKLSVDDFEKLLYQDSKVVLDNTAREKVKVNFDFLQAYAQNKVIYGINTGFGPMAQYKISEEDQRQLQFNLIRSHSAGSGQPFSEELSRATMLARLNSLMQGVSGVHVDAADLIRDLLNNKISACIFERGGVGASGDLVQLAHLALNLIGEGEVFSEGKLRPVKEVFAEKQIKPLDIYLREGLGLMNGTSAMTGVGMVNLIQAKRLLSCATILSAITNELMKSFDDHFSEELNHVKLHPGQTKIAAGIRKVLADSKLIRKRPEHLYHRKIVEAVFTDKVQEYYSLRCVPQILGPVYDTLAEVQRVLEDEVNSANDNPVIDHEREMVYHGGNFHGDYVSLAMDKLKIVITKLTMLSERQLNYLLNDKLNQKLPPFINLGTLGLNFGLQGMQFMATSTTAENQTLSFPMYLHSISNNNDNQDIVSMGCNSAFLAKKVIDNSFDVLTIQLFAVVQAIDYLKCQTRLSSFTTKVYEEFRALVGPVLEDKPRYNDIQTIRKYLVNLGSTFPLN
ncbi:HAL/PAL/TAL family ammonia-lyase [Ohtaekwangia koreensis]|jgi:histidine ammonia-lyase|uniref:Histidine ammonia-lyase n=1 Tax=Ohtaekwangia koreensis TaxID=688867 RepID=A0A1T5JIP1_9BACT|nr:aromatic amino acid ammonia-lyase [Ohtaekwangia koreensis]SKC51289.1 histidine ammonia-lyase [Ohtaekwangia koreensis]